MRAVALIALLLAGCAGAPATASPTAPAATAAPATPTASPSKAPSPSPTATPATATVRTADDEEIATLITTSSDEAVAQLKVLNDMDPSKLEDLFLPLGEWITGQRTSVEAYTPTTCTATAVGLFDEALDKYDAIRKQFLAWRDWGAQGHAFPVGAPRDTATTFTAALAELEAQCAA